MPEVHLAECAGDNVEDLPNHAYGLGTIEPEGYQYDDPSRSDRVVLTDEPAYEIPAPDLGDLFDRGNRGRVLRDC